MLVYLLKYPTHIEQSISNVQMANQWLSKMMDGAMFPMGTT
jgi:hypothetical protein